MEMVHYESIAYGFYTTEALFLSEGQISDYKGAEVLLDQLPGAKHLLADRGYDADWFKDWRRIATRYDRCAHTFFSAIQIAAIVIWWI